MQEIYEAKVKSITKYPPHGLLVQYLDGTYSWLTTDPRIVSQTTKRTYIKYKTQDGQEFNTYFGE